MLSAKIEQERGVLRLRWFYLFFIVSGFCSLTYEVVWLRLAMAQFGVNTPFVAIVLSVFMGGIAIGSVAAGWLANQSSRGNCATPLRLYALSEFVIGISCVAVPPLFEFGHKLLNQAGGGTVWGSGSYYLSSGFWIAATLLPFTACMGATIPLAMWAIRRGVAGEQKSFSYLYASNVLGATAGTVAAAFLLIEFIGFRNTGRVAGLLNVAVAAAAFALSRHVDSTSDAGNKSPATSTPRRPGEIRKSYTMFLLFMTGLASLGMEVVWTRQFTPYLGTVVYAFSGTLALYLGATFIGSSAYRLWISSSPNRDLHRALRVLLLCIGVVGLFPIIVSDPRVPLPLERAWALARVILGVVPFCGLIGFLSPLLVDGWSQGDPKRAGNAYGVNTLGCILGPLLASFVLLPAMNERWVIFVFLAPTVLAGLTLYSGIQIRPVRWIPSAATIVLVVAMTSIVAAAQDPENLYPQRVVKRDYTATVVAATVKNEKHLFTNGQGMVYLTPVTKMMAHLPLALLADSPKDGLVICFGMGTSLRSMHTWGVNTTGVELVPSVPSMMGYFHKDGPEILSSPRVEVEIDDGRRFLERTRSQFDVITVDPPPPVEAAASSLLYSVEWYALIKQRLRPTGILQEWLPYGDLATMTAVSRALKQSFPYVRVFNSFEGWGFHFLASMSPINVGTASELTQKLPSAAVADLVEMGPHNTAEEQFQSVLGREVPLEVLLNAQPDVAALTDDRPTNEYFLWRRLLKNDWRIYFSYRSGEFINRRMGGDGVQ